jgi:pimeloyl-ACP methyl ester carboxylesterase
LIVTSDRGGTVLRGQTVAGVPVLLAAPAVGKAARLPAVLWCHGFRADALSHAAELERCARAGFLAVGIDAVGHGARRDPALAERIGEAGGALPVMLSQVEQTVAELPALVDALVAEHRADHASVSLVGISMGAFLAYRAVSAGLPLRAVVALLGSPEWPTATSAHRAPAQFGDCALLSITAEHDGSVPPAAVTRLHAALDARFGATPSRRHEVLRGAGHLTSQAEWAQAMGATMQWLGEYGA